MPPCGQPSALQRAFKFQPIQGLQLAFYFSLQANPASGHQERRSALAVLGPSASRYLDAHKHSLTRSHTHLCPLLTSHLFPSGRPQTTWTGWEAAWRTAACTAWRTAPCSWSAAPSRSERSSTGSCRGPTTSASMRCVRPEERRGGRHHTKHTQHNSSAATLLLFSAKGTVCVGVWLGCHLNH